MGIFKLTVLRTLWKLYLSESFTGEKLLSIFPCWKLLLLILLKQFTATLLLSMSQMLVPLKLMAKLVPV